MLPLYYGALLIGVGLLAADIAGGLRADRRRVLWWRALGGLAAGAVGIAPFLFMIRAPGWWQWPFPVLAAAYAASAALYLLGIIEIPGGRPVMARRAGYAALLLLGALPSWLLITLAPAIGLAGIGLVQPRRSH